jgi:hypothetical protein
MTHRPVTPSPTAERGREAHRGTTRGRLLVADYVGQAAAEAAQAVRRAGLRPGLERSFDCSPELLGQVVAHEPPAGSELGRNAMVTLYVGAPGATAVDDDPAGHPAPSSEPDPSSAKPDEALQVDGYVHGEQPRARRRRKGRPVDWAPRLFDSSCELNPTAPGSLADAHPTGQLSREERWAATADDDHVCDAVPGRDGNEELMQNELVADANQVFAGRAGASWRRVYPARYRLTSPVKQHQRRWSQ